jgi:HD-like signal output (HDOD) protein
MEGTPANSARPPSLDEVCGKALRLPSAPSLMPRLIAVLEDSNSGAEEIEGVIQLDLALSASTLRLANSAFFGSGQPVETVAEAVIRLGLREIYRLAALALVNRWDSGSGIAAYGGDPGDFCRHALCVALAAEVLAEKTGRVDPQIAYTAGLVSDMGKLAVAHACGAFFPAIRARQKQDGCAWTKAERDVLGYDCSDVSAQLMRKWRFPPVLVTAAEYSNRPESSPADARPLLALLHCAKYLAVSFGPGVVEDGFLFEFKGAFVNEFGITQDLLEGALPLVLERASARLHEKLTHGTVSV